MHGVENDIGRRLEITHEIGARGDADGGVLVQARHGRIVGCDAGEGFELGKVGATTIDCGFQRACGHGTGHFDVAARFVELLLGGGDTLRKLAFRRADGFGRARDGLAQRRKLGVQAGHVAFELAHRLRVAGRRAAAVTGALFESGDAGFDWLEIDGAGRRRVSKARLQGLDLIGETGKRAGVADTIRAQRGQVAAILQAAGAEKGDQAAENAGGKRAGIAATRLRGGLGEDRFLIGRAGRFDRLRLFFRGFLEFRFRSGGFRRCSLGRVRRHGICFRLLFGGERFGVGGGGNRFEIDRHGFVAGLVAARRGFRFHGDLLAFMCIALNLDSEDSEGKTLAAISSIIAST